MTSMLSLPDGNELFLSINNPTRGYLAFNSVINCVI